MSKPATAGPAAPRWAMERSTCANAAAPALRDFKVIWRQQPKVSGDGHFSHRIAFGPDGFLYLSSGERQKMAPAQDFSGNLGKVLRLTDEGAPGAGQPLGVARRRRRPVLDNRPPQRPRPVLRSRRAIVGSRNGPAGRRRDQLDRRRARIMAGRARRTAAIMAALTSPITSPAMDMRRPRSGGRRRSRPAA